MFSISVVILQCDFLCEKFAPDKVFWQCLGRYHEELNASPAPKHLRLSQYVWEDEDRIPTEYRFGIIQKSIGTSIHARHTITSELLLNNYYSENNNNAYNFARWKTSEIISSITHIVSFFFISIRLPYGKKPYPVWQIILKKIVILFDF